MQELEHSAKGSTWKNHKYTGIKIVNGKKRYLYKKYVPVKPYLGKQALESGINLRTGGRQTASRSKIEKTGSVGEEISSTGRLTGTVGKGHIAYAANQYKTKKALENAMSKVSNKSVSSVTEKAMKTLSTAAKRTRTSADVSIKTEKGSKITIENVYPNYNKKKRYQ